MIGRFFRHGSCAAIALAIVAGVAIFAAGFVAFRPLAAVIGALVFFVSEYITHRFVFHGAPSRVPWILKLQHRLHYDHHIDPPALELLFLPLWFVVPMALVYFGAFSLITHSAALAASALFGVLCATFYYEWVHYVAHVPFTPVTPIGVSNPSMDFVGATYRNQEQVERSTTVREIWRGV